MSTTITMHIGGMTCSGCTNSVNNLLQALPGVTRVEVLLAEKTATITYDPTQTGPTQFQASIVGAGFDCCQHNE